jgi:hypothetical protein
MISATKSLRLRVVAVLVHYEGASTPRAVRLQNDAQASTAQLAWETHVKQSQDVLRLHVLVDEPPDLVLLALRLLLLDLGQHPPHLGFSRPGLDRRALITLLIVARVRPSACKAS